MQGTLASASGPVGVSLTYTRDGALLTDRCGPGAITGSVQRTYDNDFRVRNYGLAGQLAGVLKDGVSVALYDHDPNGNRLARTTPLGVESGTYDAQDRVLTYGSKSYSYTATGAVAQRIEYDEFGRVLSDTNPRPPPPRASTASADPGDPGAVHYGGQGRYECEGAVLPDGPFG